MRKKYRACACNKAGYCPRYKRDMPQEYWELCQTSEKHRMLFDELAGNFYFGMVQKHDTGKKQPSFSPATDHKKRLIENARRNPREVSPNKMNAEQANKAIQELKKEGLNLKTLGTIEERGLGDTVERILTKFGLTKELMGIISGKSCGCSERKKWLNKLLPYGKAKLPETEEPTK